MMYLLPQPEKVEKGQGIYRLLYSGTIRLDDSCTTDAYSYAKLLQQEIRQMTACDYRITTVTCMSAKQDHKNCILFSIEKNALEAVKNSEAYHISVKEEGIRLIGYGEAGLLYAVQTLRQLIRQYGTAIPVLEMEDRPAIVNRGFYYDVSRGRIPTLEELKRLADTCSFYKLNQLQLYVEHSYLFEEFSETWRDNTPLTAEEIMEFDAYCAALHIDLVPSLASFGHLYGVLRTKQYGHLSEIEDAGKGYFLLERMQHHTVDVTNEDSFHMVRDRILDYMKLFRSDKFNICADETFDLGRGKSKVLAEKKGVTELYLEFLNQLCQLLVDENKIPMFWGDIILRSPESITRLPGETICLNWEYNADVTEDNLRTFVESGAKHLYVCPGVQGWHFLVNNHHDAYLNISKMCRNGHKYKVEGVLNTCWGDLGHISHPEFSNIGLIYGAAFSWSNRILAEEEINAGISLLEYGDRRKEVVSILSEISDCCEDANWWRIVEFKEGIQKGESKEYYCERLLKRDASAVCEHLKKTENTIQMLYDKVIELDSSQREKIAANILMMKGHMLWSIVAGIFTSEILHTENPFRKDYPALAKELEEWLMDYKKLWRKVDKESELHRLVDVVCWYADRLREM